MMLLRALCLSLALAAAPAGAQSGAAGAGQGPDKGSTGGSDPPVGQMPVKPRTPGDDYGGPGDTVPPAGPTDPGDPPGNPPPEGPSGPGAPDQPGTGGPSHPPTVPPGGGALGPTQPTTDPGVLGDDLTSWAWWWELNKEPFLILPELERPMTGGGEELLAGRPPSRAPDGRPSAALIEGKIVPALLRALGEERSNDVLSASAVALARLGASMPPDAKRALSAALAQKLAGSGPAVTEAATLALGILGDDSAAPLLADLMLGTRDARDALGESRVPMRVRAFAAYALGLLGSSTANEDVRRYAVHQLVWCLETDRSGSVDLDAACVNALGVVPVRDQHTPLGEGEEPAPPGSSLSAEVDYLLALLAEERRDSRVRAQVPIALGRLLAAADGPSAAVLRQRVAEALFDVLAAHRREPRELVQSCVIALGQIGDADGDELDRRIRRTLLRIEDLVNDVPTRQYAVIALGRVCGRPGAGKPDPLREERAYLQREFSRGGTLMRPWAALALGIAERDAVQDTGTRRALVIALDDARVEREIGAYSLSAGLARAREAGPVLLEKLGGRGDQATLGHVALGIGLAGSSACVPSLLAVLPEARFQPALLHDAALGLELLGEDRVTTTLIELLQGASSASSQTAAGLALARTKDERAVLPLLSLFEDTSASALARAYAAAALGALGDRSPLPWRALYSVDANLHAAPETLFAPAGGGLLNLF